MNLDCPDLDFIYNDTDTHPNEIAELYSYTELHEFHLNVKVNLVCFVLICFHHKLVRMNFFLFLLLLLQN